MTNVVEVQPKGEKAGIIVLEDGQRVWTPELEKAQPLVGKPIPSDWNIKEGQYGPQAFPPRQARGGGGGAAAFRNTKEGQAIEQERMDRRTALMQAVQVAVSGSVSDELMNFSLHELADLMYAWLRKTSGGGISSPPVAPSTGPSSTVEKEPSRTSTGGGGGLIRGGEATSTPACTHQLTTPFKPDNKSPLPAGKVRCLECNAVIKEAS